MSSANNILVVGGSRGIGLGIVKHTLAAYPQATIFATARSPSGASGLQELVKSSNGRVEVVQADVLDQHSLHQAAEEIAKKTKTLDIVIYNAGLLNGIGNLLEVGIKPLKENIDINLYGAYYAAVEFTPLLLQSKYERKALVLLTSSFASMQLSDEIAATHIAQFGGDSDATAMYNISKTALNRLGKELDTALRRKGLPVVLIHPGLAKTDMNPYGDITADESSSGVVKTIQAIEPGDKNFYSWKGEALPW